MKKIYALLACFGLAFVSCSDDDGPATTPVAPTPPPVEITSGSADFSNYVALGNSLTAGFSDSALFTDGQENSFPNMLAGTFALAGGGAFNIPFMADNLGGATLNGQPLFGNRLILSFASGSPAPVPVSGMGTTEISNILPGPFNNMGVPGAKSFHLLLPGYGSLAGIPLGLANPYYARFASAPDATMLGDAAAQNPTFFTLWAGNNDILSFATSGGAGVDQAGNLDPSTYGGNDITDPTVFGGVYTQLLQALTANGADGAVANLPNVTSLPFFTTVPFNAVPLDAGTAALLNSNFAAYNGGLQLAATPVIDGGLGLITPEEATRRTIVYQEGQNAMLMLDEDVTDLNSLGLPNLRQTSAEDLVVFTAQTIIGTLPDPSNPTLINGVSVPLADQWVLTPEEQASITTAQTAFNQTIAALATQFDVALVDAATFLDVVDVTGVPLADGSTVTSTYGTGGGFSLDGVHPSPRGYALIANLFREAINEKYGSNLPEINPLAFTGLYVN